MAQKEDQYIKFLPYLGSFIVFLGVYRLDLYYTAFNINIINFLEFSEILTSFMDIILFIVLTVAFSLVQNHFLNSKESVVRKSEIKAEILVEKKFSKRLKLYATEEASTLFGMLIGFLILYLFISLNDKFELYPLIILVSIPFTLFCFHIFLGEIEVKHREMESSQSYRQIIRSIILFGIVTGVLIFMTKMEIKTVKNDKKYYKVVIVLDDTTKLISDSTNYYIGKTQNYLFYFHEKLNTTDVYPIRRIKQLAFPKANYR